MSNNSNIKESTRDQIRAKIKAKKRGQILLPEDFVNTGSSEAVRLALHRLEKENFIKRVAHGIYVRPKINRYIGEITPSAEEVALAVAKRDKIKIVPTGAFALHALGLSNQIPMKIVYLTDGAPREIQVGKRTIKLKKTTPKNLMAKGRISALVIQALREIGKENVTTDLEEKITKLLREEDPKNLYHDIRLAPKWIQQIMQKGGKQ